MKGRTSWFRNKWNEFKKKFSRPKKLPNKSDLVRLDNTLLSINQRIGIARNNIIGVYKEVRLHRGPKYPEIYEMKTFAILDETEKNISRLRERIYNMEIAVIEALGKSPNSTTLLNLNNEIASRRIELNNAIRAYKTTFKIFEQEYARVRKRVLIKKRSNKDLQKTYRTATNILVESRKHIEELNSPWKENPQLKNYQVEINKDLVDLQLSNFYNKKEINIDVIFSHLKVHGDLISRRNMLETAQENIWDVIDNSKNKQLVDKATETAMRIENLLIDLYNLEADYMIYVAFILKPKK